MQNKITLITPPDFYENGNLSILLIGMSDIEQDIVSQWLGKNDINRDINIYTYQGENNVEWFLYALGRSDFKYINLDNEDPITNVMTSYIASRPEVYYHSENKDIVNLISYLNNNSVNNIEEFFERIFNDK
jgi:hypothetical protein